MANKDKVYEDYEKIADWFDTIRMRDLGFEKPYLDLAVTYIKKGGKVLDLGCGMGQPVTKYFIDKGFQVTGVDGSVNMIEKTRNYLPRAKFYVQDMRHLNLHDKFDGIILWHSLFHLSAADQKLMLKTIVQHINPAGVLLFTTGHEEGEVWGENGGENLYHSSLSPVQYQELLKSNNFKLILNKIEDPECGDATIWLAQYLNQD